MDEPEDDDHYTADALDRTQQLVDIATGYFRDDTEAGEYRGDTSNEDHRTNQAPMR